jgi:hypothetical protein
MRTTIMAACRVLAFSLLAGAPATADEGFTPLFDGRSLAGWTIKSKPADRQRAERFWRVDRGAILADSMGETGHDYVWLVTIKEYGDFVLRLRFQVARDVKGNSGVQVRSRYDDEAGWLDGPQVDIHPPGPWRTGMIWDETRGNQRWLYPTVAPGKWVDPSMAVEGHRFFYADEGDGWNDMEIAAEGTKLRAVLNGVTVMEYDGAGVLDDAVHQRRNVGMRGMIALQIHKNDQVRIRFKDLRIREL